MPDSKIVNCFFAYPSQPISLSETIDAAITSLNATGYVKVESWKGLHVSGRIIIDEICRAIDNSQLLLCEVTHLNPNVLFELGYAVAKNKRVWLALDTSYPTAVSSYKQVKVLNSIGYSTYRNSIELVSSFLKDQPFFSLENTLYNELISPIQDAGMRLPRLLYLKSPVETEASIQLTRLLTTSHIPIVTDDPTEVPIQTLDWYVEQVTSSCAAIAHLLDENRSNADATQNAKYAFVSGLAYGLGKPLLMLAHSPYSTPFDYQHLLAVHTSSVECIELATPWLEQVSKDQAVERAILDRGRSAAHAAESLRKIYLGDYIAENEQDDLANYFIETAAFSEALHAAQSMVYVGRKGTGKTANLYQIAEELRRNKANHVCILKPVDYDLDGVLQLLSLSIPMSEQGYLMQSLWKYLVYTQIAISYCERLEKQPSYIQPTPQESSLISFVEANSDLIKTDFTTRLDHAISQLCDIQFSKEPASNRKKVSEILHENLLAQLRLHLGDALSDKSKVCVLVDNLDKAWRLQGDLPRLSDFIFGLTSVSRAITDEFRRTGPAWRSVNVTVLVFLRSDIFSYLLTRAREADKLVFSSIDWSDERLLHRIIEERFIHSLQQDLPHEEIWSRFFTPSVHGVPTKNYLVSHVIPRPRDIIYICKAALARAINRGNAKIEEEDILLAEKEYSQYAFLTLLSEIKPQYPKVEEFLIELAGMPDVISEADIEQSLNKASLPAVDSSILIPLLIESLFLGPEVEVGTFRFLYDHMNLEIIKALARATAVDIGHERYRINTAFHSYLELNYG